MNWSHKDQMLVDHSMVQAFRILIDCWFLVALVVLVVAHSIGRKKKVQWIQKKEAEIQMEGSIEMGAGIEIEIEMVIEIVIEIEMISVMKMNYLKPSSFPWHWLQQLKLYPIHQMRMDL